MYYYAIALEQQSVFKEAYSYAKMVTESGMGGEALQQKANESSNVPVWFYALMQEKKYGYQLLIKEFGII